MRIFPSYIYTSVCVSGGQKKTKTKHLVEIVVNKMYFFFLGESCENEAPPKKIEVFWAPENRIYHIESRVLVNAANP